jgi:hypothetical protein
LLDAGPIIKLFEIGLWEKFIKRYDVTIARTVVEEAVYTGRCDSFCYIDFPFEQADDQGLIKIIDKTRGEVKDFLINSGIGTKYRIDPGEAETLAFLVNSSEDFVLCTADGPVFSTLGFLGKAEKGISLEELLQKRGLTPSQKLAWRFTKKFRDKYTALGRIDAAQGQGLV